MSCNPIAPVLRQDFMAFVHRCFVELNPSAKFLPNWHLDLMAMKLEAVRRGKIRRLILNVPPRSLKSLVVSVAFPAWWLGHKPSDHVMGVSYAQDLANKLSADCRRVMNTSWYRAIFPQAALTGAKQAVNEFTTARGGSRYATSVGGVITGRGANLLVIDDPLKPEEALSETQRNNVNHFYGHTLVSRLNDKKTDPIVLVMQRLHEQDLTGYVQDLEPWEVLSLSAIAEEDEEHWIETPWGKGPYVRRAGEALHPEREPLEVLEAIRKAQGPYDFSGQYQQSPAPLGGGLVKTAWFRTYEDRDRPQSFDQVVQSWDTANKASELADYSVCTTWGRKGAHIYLLNVFRKRLEYPDLKRAVLEQKRLYQAQMVLIEDKASGTQLIQELRNEGLYGVKAYKPDHDKLMRMHAQTATIENGFVHIPKEAHWLSDYLRELASFPKGRHDDQVDSTSQALCWMAQEAAEPGIFRYYRELAEKGFE